MTRISDVLRRKGEHVVTIEPDASVASFIAQLAEHRIGAIVVSNDGVKMLGIVSERDVVRRLHETPAEQLMDRPVSELMTSDVVSCQPDSTIDEVMAIMTQRRVRHVPVLDAGRLAGLVSIGDVVLTRIDELQHERDQLTAYITG